MTISPPSRKKGRRLRRRSIVLIAMGVVVAVIATVVTVIAVNLPDDLEIGRLSQKSNLYATTSAGTPTSSRRSTTRTASRSRSTRSARS
ncbi:hypothetical protein [Cryobacterium sp. 10C3]|uniref:hypothetical protein n=1 Tax=Cryobacterium sp. 10C3 TaxID=3048577 RepID=UPI002AB56079|nr:hypothetical protein [Cryobacterium sp. 10C3]MDY7557056.1 hypothetical protein [Cryobacterium sp. 10C3]